MIKNIGDNYKIYGLIIFETIKKLLMLEYGISNATFEPPNHAFTLVDHDILYNHTSLNTMQKSNS